MVKGLISHIAESFKGYPSKVFLVENNDRFLYRSDVVQAFAQLGIEISNGSNLEQRMQFEMREPDEILILLSQNISTYLEDIKSRAVAIEFRLASYLLGYHIPAIKDLELPLLDGLFSNKQLIGLNKNETLSFVKKLKEEYKSSIEPYFNIEEFVLELNSMLIELPVNWSVVGRFIAKGIIKTIRTPHFEELFSQINKANECFQAFLLENYEQTKNSNAVKKPRIVSRILDYLHFNYLNNKVALIVIDGMAVWQYELLRNTLPGNKQEEVICSWLPSITQLSRQAIFRGGKPKTGYRQGPLNEEKLWKEYWMSKGLKKYEIAYYHEKIDQLKIDSISKLAIVFKDLDDKMHSSSDYIDLIELTKNWIERSNISIVVENLLKNEFTVFLTSDHGNIQAKGWRGLQSREKLGTNKSGSRSQRHIEYSKKWLLNEFIEKNPEIRDSLLLDDQSIYFKTDFSFSNKKSLVTHGGSHLLEVLIPFIKIDL